MSKGARLKMERELGTRKPNGQRWNQIPNGMRLTIPSYAMVKMGNSPFVIPLSIKQRLKNPIDPRLAVLSLGFKTGTMNSRWRGSNRLEFQAAKRKRRKH